MISNHFKNFLDIFSFKYKISSFNHGDIIFYSVYHKQLKLLYSKTNLEPCQRSEYLFKNTKECNAMQAHMKTLFENPPPSNRKKKNKEKEINQEKNGYTPATYLN